MRIHPLASVDPTAVIGEGTTVGPFAVIGAGVVIGRDCEIRSHAVVNGPGTTLGDRNRLHEGCVAGGDPQSAFDGWFSSSGHHRNMLMKGWSEPGSGL